jgi:hypothetical protein
VSPVGTLTPVPGSTFGTGVTIPEFGSAVVVSPVDNFLFTSQPSRGAILTYTINPFSGALTRAQVSTVSIGLPFNLTSLAITPNGRFLYAAPSFGRIAVFRIAFDGSLTRTAGPELFVGSLVEGLSVSPDGRWLGVIFDEAIQIARILPNGTLESASMMIDRTVEYAGAEFNCTGDLMFVGQEAALDLRIASFQIDASGLLTQVPGSPFVFPDGRDSEVVLRSSDGRFLFVANALSGTVSVLRIMDGGVLEAVDGSPFFVGIPSSDRIPLGLITDRFGRFLFSTNGDSTVSAFSIASGGQLASVPGSPFSGAGGFASTIAAYPQNSCGQTSNFDVCIQDDVNGALLLFSSVSGDYQVIDCRKRRVLLVGRGLTMTRFCKIELLDPRPGVNLIAVANKCTGVGNMFLKDSKSAGTLSISDSFMGNNSCGCR